MSLNRVIEDTYQLLRSTLDPSVAIEHAARARAADAARRRAAAAAGGGEPGPGGARPAASAAASLRLTHARVRAAGAPPRSRGRRPQAQRMVALEIAGRRRARRARLGAGPRPPASRERGAGLALTIAEDIARAHGGYLRRPRPAATRARSRSCSRSSVRDETPLLDRRGGDRARPRDHPGGRRRARAARARQDRAPAARLRRGDRGERRAGARDPAQGRTRASTWCCSTSRMPGLSGREGAARDPRLPPELPVIIASGYATVESQSSWMAAGRDGLRRQAVPHPGRRAEAARGAGPRARPHRLTRAALARCPDAPLPDAPDPDRFPAVPPRLLRPFASRAGATR